MRDLTLLEQMILAAVIALKEDAYGVSIRKRVERLTGKRMMYGTLYNALDQLLRKGYVAKTRGATSSSRGGATSNLLRPDIIREKCASRFLQSAIRHLGKYS
ncbi:helix-turn-helix transcriptional regulator [Acidobacteriota bacterium]